MQKIDARGKNFLVPQLDRDGTPVVYTGIVPPRMRTAKTFTRSHLH